jgi:hypothetical protein
MKREDIEILQTMSDNFETPEIVGRAAYNLMEVPSATKQ